MVKRLLLIHIHLWTFKFAQNIVAFSHYSRCFPDCLYITVLQIILFVKIYKKHKLLYIQYNPIKYQFLYSMYEYYKNPLLFLRS